MSEPLVVLLSYDRAVDETAAAVLRNEGYHVEVARTGAAASQMLDGGEVELVLLDLTVHSVDGYLLYRALRPLPRDNRPAMLLLVDDAAEPAARELIAGGRAATLAKPFFADQLVVAVRALLADRAGVSPADTLASPTGLPAGHEAAAKGKIIAVYGAKGGIGKTFIALNVAAALAKAADARVAVVDADLQFGEVAARLRLPVDRNLSSLATLGGSVTWPAVRGVVYGHRSGLDAVVAPPQPWLAEHVSAELLVGLLSLLKDHYPYVVVDTHTSYDQKTLVTLDQADDILLVASQAPLARRNALSFMAVAKRLGYTGKVRVVLNWFDGQQAPSIDRLEKELRTRLIATIRADLAGVAALERHGDPLLGGDGAGWAAQDVTTLADSIARLAAAARAVATPRVTFLR